MRWPVVQFFLSALQQRRSQFLLLGMGLGIAGMVISFLFLVWVTVIHSRTVPITSDNSQPVEEESSKSPLPASEVTAEVSGAVHSPGVYRLPTESRIEDLVKKAGGIRSEADWQYVQKKLNLAEKITDEMKLIIPFQGEEEESTAVSSGFSASNLETTNSSQISLNTATAQQLDELPGIGEKTAEKIIQGRPYSDTSELIDKKIVSENVFLKLKSLIRL